MSSLERRVSGEAGWGVQSHVERLPAKCQDRGSCAPIGWKTPASGGKGPGAEAMLEARGGAGMMKGTLRSALSSSRGSE